MTHRLAQLKSEVVVYEPGEFSEPRPQCTAADVARHRRGVVADSAVPADELVIEYMVSVCVLVCVCVCVCVLVRVCVCGVCV